MGWFEKKIEGKNASKWFELGERATDPEEKIKCYDKALELNPKDKYAWNNKGNTFYNMSKYEDAIKCFNKTIELIPEDEYAWNSKGNALYTMRKYEDAIKCYDKALEINPDNQYAWKNKVAVLKQLGRYDPKKMIRWEICEIRAKDAPGSKMTFSWLDSSWHGDFVLQAILINNLNKEVVIAKSPVFHAFGLKDLPALSILDGYNKGSTALNILRANLMSDGWERMIDVNGQHWYSDSFRRRVE